MEMESGTLHAFLQGSTRQHPPKAPTHLQTNWKRWGHVEQEKSALAFQIVVKNVNLLPPRHHNNSKPDTIRKFDRHYSVNVRCMSELNTN